MKTFHITYFLEGMDTPTLGGFTVQSENIVSAIAVFMQKKDININNIKYIIEL